MRTRILICALAAMVLTGCTSDDPVSEEPIKYSDVRGTVLGVAACHTESNGLAYEIDLKNNNSIGKIVTPNLPEEFKEEGLEIVFVMEQSMEDLTLCAAIYSPEIFYKVSQVSRFE